MNYVFPLLNKDDIECRIGTISEGKGFSVLLYKTARTDMQYLDQVVGLSNWKNRYELINGVLFCTIEIWDDAKKEWVAKCDCGTESQTEAEKGQASDAFKRAGFRVGIGRELYNAPFIWFSCEQAKNKMRATFEIKEYEVDEETKEFMKLVIEATVGKEKYTYSMRPSYKPKDHPVKATKQGITESQKFRLGKKCNELGITIDEAMSKAGLKGKLEDLDEAQVKDLFNWVADYEALKVVLPL